jgi:hypothetical protein
MHLLKVQLKDVAIFRKHSELAHGTLQELHLARHFCAGDTRSVKIATNAFQSWKRGVSDFMGRFVVHMYGNRYVVRMRLTPPWQSLWASVT